MTSSLLLIHFLLTKTKCSYNKHKYTLKITITSNLNNHIVTYIHGTRLPTNAAGKKVPSII
jgi:hypothetical protein